MRYPPAGTRAHHYGGRGGCRTTPPSNFKDLNASKSCVHKTCKNSGSQTLEMSLSGLVVSCPRITWLSLPITLVSCASVSNLSLHVRMQQENTAYLFDRLGLPLRGVARPHDQLGLDFVDVGA